MTAYTANISQSLNGLETAMAKKLTGNGTLRHEEEKAYDDMLIDVTRQRAQAVGLLQAMGLTQSGSIGDIISLYETVSDTKPANISMYAEGEKENVSVLFGEVGVRIPVIHSHFTINDRQLASSRKRGATLDVTTGASATANVWLAANDMLVKGALDLGKDNAIYGITNRPGSMVASSFTTAAWNGTTFNGRTIYEEANGFIEVANEKNYFGPFVLFVSTKIYNVLNLDYNNDKGGTISVRERIEQFPAISRVVPIDQMEDDQVVMVQMTKDVLDWFSAVDIQTLEYDNPYLHTNYMVYMIGAPRVKINQQGNTGIVRSA